MDKLSTPDSIQEPALPILLEKHFDFSVWLINRVRKFHSDLRSYLGKSIIDIVLTVMDLLVLAYSTNNGSERINYLKEADTLLLRLRLKLRMAFKLKLMPARSLNYAISCLIEEGKMLGGWIKKESGVGL